VLEPYSELDRVFSASPGLATLARPEEQSRVVIDRKIQKSQGASG